MVIEIRHITTKHSATKMELASDKAKITMIVLRIIPVMDFEKKLMKKIFKIFDNNKTKRKAKIGIKSPSP